MVRYGGFTQQAIIAQWLEHWSRKPGVVSSTLTMACVSAGIWFKGIYLFVFLLLCVDDKVWRLLSHHSFWLEHWSRKPGVMIRYGGFTQQAIIAQWLEHWSRKPGVVSSTLTDGLCFGWNMV
ncbi:hypothetical protein CEXT_376971 [Caerostris extrusa]|uniref:Uncharacterized protein n=1 Tax=Caerostris extrusa TaxID=172846 RepID=A0AAV4Y8Y9_CAEEX|nr:hypothetical protein CEXT_376971 [Caerostris extrusa]